MGLILTISFFLFSLLTIIMKKFTSCYNLTVILIVFIFSIQSINAQTSTSWISSSSGDWNNAANWSNGVPTSNSDVIINNNGSYGITISKAVSIRSLTFGTSGSGAHTLIINNTLTLQNGGVWASGTIQGSDTLINNGTLTVQGTVTKNLALPFDNRGTVNINGSITFYGGTLINESKGEVKLPDGAVIDNYNGGPLVNYGLLLKTGGTGTAKILVNFINYDSVLVDSGNLLFKSANTITLHGGIYNVLQGDSLIFNDDHMNVDGNLTGNPSGVIVFESKNCYADNAAANLNFNGTGVYWSYGYISGSGNGTWVNNGKFNIIGNNLKYISGVSFYNHGSIEITGNPTLNGGSLINESDGTVTMLDSALLDNYNGKPFTNYGHLIIEGGTNTVKINCPFINYNDVAVNSGNLLTKGDVTLIGGTYNASGGDSLIFASDHFSARGNLTGSPSGSIIFENKNNFADSTAANLNFSGTGLHWLYGYLNKSGNGSWVNNGKLYIEGPQFKSISGVNFYNHGSIEMTGKAIQSGGSLINESDGTITMLGSSSIDTYNGGPFINKGHLIVNSSSTTVYIYSSIINENDIEVNSGNLLITGAVTLLGGTYNASAGDSLIFASGNHFLAKGVIKGNPAGAIILDCKFYYADSTNAVLKFGGAGIQWINGVFEQVSNGSWANNGLLIVSQPGTKTISNVNFTNNDTVEINSSLTAGFHDSFINETKGIVILKDSATFSSSYKDSFYNYGTFKKIGPGEAAVTSPFATTGIIDITGTLNWNHDFDPGISSTIKIEADPQNNYGKLNVSGNAVLNGAVVVSLKSSALPGDSIVILTSQKSVSGSFYSVFSTNDTLDLKPSYTKNSVLLKVFKNLLTKTYTIVPDTVVIAGERRLNLYGSSMTNVDSVALFRVSSNRIITGQITQSTTNSITISLNLKDSVALGTENLLVYRKDKIKPDTAKVVLAPFISVPMVFREGQYGLAVEPNFRYGWSIIRILTISNDETFTMISPSIAGNEPADMRVSNAYHGFGDTLWTLSEDGDSTGIFFAKTSAFGTSNMYYSLRIDPMHVEMFAEAKAAKMNSVTSSQNKIPFGSNIALDYKGSMHTSVSQFQDVITQALDGSNNSELTNYIFSIPNWETRVPQAVSQVLSSLSKNSVSSTNEILQKVLQNLSQYKTPPSDLYNNAKNNFRSDMSFWFSKKEQQYVDKIRKSVRKSEEAKNTVHSTMNILWNEYNRTYNSQYADFSNTVRNSKETVEDEIFNHPPGTPVTDVERQFLYKIVGPWDPNNKTTNTLYSGVVQQDSTGVPYYSLYYIPIQKEADSIQYVVSFENEASATGVAHNVVITDTLDPNVDPSSIQILNTSYDSVFTWSRSGRIVTFQFTGINLPPDKNPPEGQGYVTYSVLPNPSLTNGATIKNRASVVFDYNPPILTPTVVHEIHQVGDASVKIVNIPDSVIVNNDYVIDASVNNMGPDAADSVKLTYTIPPNTTVKSVSLSSGSWKTVGNTITMTIGKLDAGQLDPLTLKLNTSKTGDESNNFSLTTSTSDANPLNNSISGKVAVALTVLGVKSENSIPNNYNLSYNYPNPFNPTTTVQFALPKAGITTLQIYNILGQRVATIMNKYLKAGRYSVHIDASRWASGVYFYRIRSGKFSKVRKMMLLK